MKKKTTLLIGTNNKGKLKEIRELLPKYIKTKSTLDFNLKSPKEGCVGRFAVVPPGTTAPPMPGITLFLRKPIY